MTTLRLDTWVMPAAEIGPENPLPSLSPPSTQSGIRIDPSVPEAARKYIGYGIDQRRLPYRIQDGYNRERRSRAFKTAVLENEFLRAVFLLDYGGRLWSLYHKPSQRELLYVNPVFQPAHLAMRNAWFSGGIEWNCGAQGHTPLTCAPIFAADVQSDHGWPVLRLWEFERQRATPYQIDFILPPDSPWLLARVRLFNPHETTIPMYWWSNIAIPEESDVRVLAPAKAAFNFGCFALMRHLAMPVHNGHDMSYPSRIPASADYFYDIAPLQHPWLAAVDRAGQGLIQTSTAAQRGRKLFVWGMGAGGQQWQKFLTDGHHPYFEIQAGVAQTQYECFPMAAVSELTWMEAYGLIQADARIVHGQNWSAAVAEVQGRLEAALPIARLNEQFRATAALADRAPKEILCHGSGWGALEALRRKRAVQSALCPSALVFDEASLTEEQQPWRILLDSGHFPESELPGAWMVQAEWRTLLEASGDDHWLAWLHRGVMRHHDGDLAGAETAWATSLQRKSTPWALRNCAVLASYVKGQESQAADLWLKAFDLLPSLLPLAVECLAALIAAERATEALSLVERMPPQMATHGRVKAMQARAALESGLLNQAEKILLGDLLVPDLREGEWMLSDLWYELQAKRMAQSNGGIVTEKIRQQAQRECQVPKHLDFRQAPGT